ncbi:MAG: hypothetical protein ABDH49_08940 [Candidatus Hydrothermales bacterium]
MAGEFYFSPKEIFKIMEDLVKYLKDLYRVYLKQRPEIETMIIKEKLKMGVIQYKLLTETIFFDELTRAILFLRVNPHTKIESCNVSYEPYEIEEISPDTITSYISLKNYEVSKILAPKKVNLCFIKFRFFSTN